MTEKQATTAVQAMRRNFMLVVSKVKKQQRWKNVETTIMVANESRAYLDIKSLITTTELSKDEFAILNVFGAFLDFIEGFGDQNYHRDQLEALIRETMGEEIYKKFKAWRAGRNIISEDSWPVEQIEKIGALMSVLVQLDGKTDASLERYKMYNKGLRADFKFIAKEIDLCRGISAPIDAYCQHRLREFDWMLERSSHPLAGPVLRFH